MAEKTKGDGHKTETPDVSHIRNVEVEHESSDINVSAVVTFAVVLAISIGIVSFGLTFLLSSSMRRKRSRHPNPGRWR
jgi:hypothetical protein